MFLKIFFIDYCVLYEKIKKQDYDEEKKNSKWYKKVYKYCLNNWENLLSYQKYTLILVFLVFLIGLTVAALTKDILYYFIGIFLNYFIFSIAITYFFSIKNQEKMLSVYKREYQQRMQVVSEILKIHSIDYKDEVKINFLIEKLREKRNEKPLLKILKKFFFSSVPLTILYIIREKILNIIENENLVFVFFIYFITVFVILLIKIIYDNTYGIYVNKYKKYYDYLIDDLKEILIFNNKFKEEN